jgi:hypothetical protein
MTSPPLAIRLQFVKGGVTESQAVNNGRISIRVEAKGLRDGPIARNLPNWDKALSSGGPTALREC